MTFLQLCSIRDSRHSYVYNPFWTPVCLLLLGFFFNTTTVPRRAQFTTRPKIELEDTRYVKCQN